MNIICSDYKQHIRTIANFPEKGTLYYDVSPLLADGPSWHDSIAKLSEKILSFKPEVLIGIEPHGYLLAAPLAYRMACGFVRARKTGKVLGGIMGTVPGSSRSLKYELGEVTIQTDLLKPGARAVILDDILATGKTASAVAKLVEEAGCEVVGAAFLIDLKGRTNLSVPYTSLMTF
jgi:adenine phosphoribosyltransferase